MDVHDHALFVFVSAVGKCRTVLCDETSYILVFLKDYDHELVTTSFNFEGPVKLTMTLELFSTFAPVFHRALLLSRFAVDVKSLNGEILMQYCAEAQHTLFMTFKYCCSQHQAKLIHGLAVREALRGFFLGLHVWLGINPKASVAVSGVMVGCHSAKLAPCLALHDSGIKFDDPL